MAAGFNEIAEGLEFLKTKLVDATLQGFAPGGVWPDMAPPGTTTPFVIIANQSGTDTLTATAFRILARPVYQVKAVGPTTVQTAIRNAANRIDFLLARTNGATANSTIEACWRDGAFILSELVAGALWVNIGGFYRLELT
jgi:hypothetical protein